METKENGSDETRREEARFDGKLYRRVETLPPPGGGDEIVVCAGPDGSRFACPYPQWRAHLVRRASAGRATIDKYASAPDKIALFMRLFAGRENVFARRFFQLKTGKSGYSPVCRNEWREGVCAKPKVKCSACGARDFAPLDADFVYRHLAGKDAHGRDVIGTYALREDGSTWFLAADFDERDWRLDAAAYRQAAENIGLSPAVERSRSGNGAHVWLFFSEPAPAADARKLGTGLLAAAMSTRPQMSFASFDRLFPSQDTVPKGGFGNLIALPLQGQARRNGNSVFVDKDFVAFDDQWAYLSSLPRVTPEELSAALLELPGDPTAPAFPAAGPTAGAETAAPGTPEPVSAPGGPLQIVLSNMLHVRKDGLPASLLADIRRIGTFPNRDFAKKQRMRLSVYGTPRFIDCSVNQEHFLSLPRGCREDLIAFLKGRGLDYAMEDQRTCGRPVDVDFAGQLRDEQAEAAEKLLRQETGVLSAATGFGKTVVGAYLIGRRKVSTLIIVPSSALLNQWKDALDRFLDVREIPEVSGSGRGRRRRMEAVGRLGAGKHTNAGIIDIAIVDSLCEGPERTAKEFVRDYGMIICDECHHVAAFTFERVLREARAKYVYGLSATPSRADGLDQIIFMQCGSIRHTVDAKGMAHDFQKVVIPRFTRTRTAAGLGIQDVYAALFANAERNARIVADAARVCEEGGTPLVLTTRLEHAAALAAGLDAVTDARVFLLRGSDSDKEKKEKLEALRAASPDEKIAVVAIGRYAGEGFDLPRLDALLVAAPVSGKEVVTQYAGRLHREYSGKREVRIFDYVDIHVPALDRMYRKRQRSYIDQGYEIRPAAEETGRSRVFAGPEYLDTFADDLRNVCEEAYVCSCGADMERLRELAPELTRLRDAGIRLTIRLGRGNPKQIAAAAAFLKKLDLGAEIAPEVSYSAAIFDRRVVWYGSIDYLGRADGDALRFESLDVAAELLDEDAPDRPRQLELDLPGV